jgi:hypothetical protein
MDVFPPLLGEVPNTCSAPERLGRSQAALGQASPSRKGAKTVCPPNPGWICNKCTSWNFGDREKCFKCDISRYTHGVAGSAAAKKIAKRKSESEESNNDVQMERMRKRMKELTSKASALGLEILESDYVAKELNMEPALVTTESQVVFKVDSGASSHFGGSQVPISGIKDCNTLVEIADGKIINVDKKGQFHGVISGSTGKLFPVNFECKKSHAFVHNLFSVKQATENGCKVTFDSDGSFIEQKADGTKIELVPDSSGWNIIMDSTAREGTALDGTEVIDETRRKAHELFDLVGSSL